LRQPKAKGDLEVKIWSPYFAFVFGSSTSTRHFTGFFFHPPWFLPECSFFRGTQAIAVD
jgi:hypothetical protein